MRSGARNEVLAGDEYGEAGEHSSSPLLRYGPALSAILFLGLALRLMHWWAVRTRPFFAELAMDSQEYDRWARVVASGNWLGSEVFFQAPLYPYTLAVIYRIFGHSYDAVYLLQSVLAVCACFALAEAARSLHSDRGGDRAKLHGLLTAALASLYAPFVFYDVQMAKESAAVSITCFLLFLWIDARRRHCFAVVRWLSIGCLLGLLILLRENALLVLPFVLAGAWAGAKRPVAVAIRGISIVFGIVLILTPVALRNGFVGGSFLPTTFQGGTNFYIGNNPEADGTYRPIVPGKQIPRLERTEPTRIAEEDRGRELTASEVSAYWLGRSLDWMVAEPTAFLRLQLRKVMLFWRWYEWPDAVDYAWVRRQSLVLWLLPVGFGSVVLLACVGFFLRWREQMCRWSGPDLPLSLWTVGWTVSTVIFFVFSRYRIPVVPALLPWAAWSLVRLWEVSVDGRSRRLSPWMAGLLVALALLLPRAMEPGPRQDLVQYNLGVLHRDGGRTALAREAFVAAYAVDSQHFLAAMNLGLLAAKDRRWAEAELWLRRALAIEPRSDDVRANLGALLLATGRIEEAEEELRQVLQANPSHPQARRNLDLLGRGNFR
ncbi:MAG: tetratricopeptide repeat protein [Thermoanaerobaculia bacterium]|nr:tetratricopeptide repeat protein [Thermoanaerobaculia bacterium]